MLVHPQFNPVAIQVGPIAIHWYGLMYLLAFTQFILLGRIRIRAPQFKALGWTMKDLEDLLFFGVLGVILGGRLGYTLFYLPDYYLSHPLSILKVWEGGMSFHGGLLGVIFSLFWFSHQRKVSFWVVSDFVAPLVLGENNRLALGDGFSFSGCVTATSFANLSTVGRRRSSWNFSLDLFKSASSFRAGFWSIFKWLWCLSIFGGICPRTRFISRSFRFRAIHGAMAFITNDFVWRLSTLQKREYSTGLNS